MLLSKRSPWPRRFLGGAAWICGARASVVGQPLRPHSLLISNHISWLDILILGGSTGCAFVSKDELRDHPLLRWIADQNRTLYVRRADRKATPHQARAIAEALHDPQPLALFPEGTVGPGDQLLPFRSALLAAVTPPPRDVDVRPVAIDYGAATREIIWYGESGKDNFLRVLGRRGKFPVVVRLLPSIAHRDDRKALANEAREAIGEALASSRASAPLYARSE
jgi:1-acyl-sn-glycerol-3-phosphate acyltransferase